jgi:ABC-2 type transport system permease protein
VSEATTDRGTWRLVARRDFWVRLRERSFLVSTLINIAVISILVFARASNAATAGPSFDLGYVGSAAVAEGTVTLAQDVQPAVEIRLHEFPDPESADAALRSGSVDAAIIGQELRGFEGVDPNLQKLAQASARNLAVTKLLDDVPQEQRDAANNPTPLAVDVLQQEPPHRSENAAIAFIAVLLLYGQLFGYGIWVASGVIEEKASRVVEMLLSAIRARQLLLGKIIGIGVLGLAQLLVISGFALTLALTTKAIPIDLFQTAVGTIGLVIGWFILGFAFYAALFAAAGSLVTRMEELQNVIVPINLTILVSFFISIGALQDPNGRLQVIASLLPMSSALAMPVRIVVGAATPWQVALSLALLIGSTILLVPLAARLYSGAVLRTRGRVRIREAWRSAE